MSTTNYVDPVELRELLVEYRTSETITPRLFELLDSIARGYARRFPVVVPLDDFLSDCHYDFVRYLGNVDPDRKPFNYLTTMVARRRLKTFKKWVERFERERKFREDYIRETHSDRYRKCEDDDEEDDIPEPSDLPCSIPDFPDDDFRF